MSNWTGMAEGPLIAYATAGVLLLRRDIETPEFSLDAAVLLGCAAAIKNEGVALLAATTVAMLLANWRTPRRLLALWPAFLIALPWQLYARFALRLSTDIFEGSVSDRALHGVAHLRQVATTLAANPPDLRLFWIGVALSVIFFWRSAVKKERFLLVVVLLQLAFYVGSYLVTPHDVAWHIENSWVRILTQIGALSGSLAMLVITYELQMHRHPAGRDVQPLDSRSD
jgi:hypothetical protein